MSSAGRSNASAAEQYQGVLERAVFSTVTTVPCCVFLLINGTLLGVLRSKALLRETSRYVLLFNLLLADTLQLIQSQLLYLLAVFRLTLTYPVCGVLVFLANLTAVISPLTLVLMSGERYVAVCRPLRHAALAVGRTTALAVAVVWTFSGLDTVVRALLLSRFPFRSLESLQMKDFCSDAAMQLSSVSKQYNGASTGFVFVSAGVAVVSSYVAVVVAARSASADTALAQKARNTLLLHLLQLVLSLSSTIYTPLMLVLYRTLTRIVFVRFQNVLYVVVILLPRCLSALIYGIRDQNIRPVLTDHLRCRPKTSDGASTRLE
ncbi:odorant receptor 131-2-like [Brachyistius frenatus]|uniref:odorant receptor 131-2-like n=1 Tax=Brachyistius frenatus TaxID=100188 RepID=UPI0037E7779F